MTLLLFFVMLQVVETNLVAFDCHWILINEVRPSFMIVLLAVFLQGLGNIAKEKKKKSQSKSSV